MIRNMFARNKPSISPYISPTRASPYPAANTVVLTPSKRSVNGWQSPSPEPGDEGTPTPNKATMQHTFQEVKQELREIQASDEPINVPAGQKIDSSKSSGESNGVPHQLSATLKVKGEFTPTFKNSSLEEENPFLSSSTAVGKSSGEVEGTPRPRKRVRMASPDLADRVIPHSSSSQPLLSIPPNLSASQISLRSDPTDDSSSTVPSNLSSTAWTWHLAPPSRSHVATTMEEYGVDTAIYTDPHYSNAADVPARPKMFAGRMFSLKGNGLKELEEFEGSFPSAKGKGKSRAKQGKSSAGQYGWEYAPLPPSRKQVVAWCEKEDAVEAEQGGSSSLADLGHDQEILTFVAQKHALATSQLAKPTQKNQYGFKFSQKQTTKDSEREHQNMSVLALEVFGEPWPISYGSERELMSIM